MLLQNNFEDFFKSSNQITYLKHTVIQFLSLIGYCFRAGQFFCIFPNCTEMHKLQNQAVIILGGLFWRWLNEFVLCDQTLKNKNCRIMMPTTYELISRFSKQIKEKLLSRSQTFFIIIKQVWCIVLIGVPDPRTKSEFSRIHTYLTNNLISYIFLVNSGFVFSGLIVHSPV